LFYSMQEDFHECSRVVCRDSTWCLLMFWGIVRSVVGRF
jgi:hypothetical protein